jgi:type I restriction enzyme S subunit
LSHSDVPKGWTVASIDDVATSSGGSTPSKSDPSFWTNGNIPWVSPKDMKTFDLRSSEDLVSERALARLTEIPENSVLLVVRSGILSRTLPVAVNTIPVTINQDMRAFIPEKNIEPRFIAWQLIANERNILDNCSKDGTTVASIEGPALSAFPLSIAPAAEQTRIVEKLEELLSDLDAGVAELKAAQVKLARYRQSLLKAAVEGALTAEWRAARAGAHPPPRAGEGRGGGAVPPSQPSPARGGRGQSETGAQLLQRILTERRARWQAKQLAKFAEQCKAPPKDWQKKYPEPVQPDTSELPELPEGWVWASVEQISEIQGGIQKQPSRAPVENKYPFLRVANVARGKLKLDDVHEIELFPGEIERLELAAGDVLIVEGNGSLTEIGRCALWDGSIANAVHQNHLIRVRPIGVVSQFVETWLNSLGGIEKLTKLAATTSGLYTLSVGKISKIPVPVAPRAEQEACMQILAEALSALDLQEQSVAHSLKQSTAQRKNILRAAFSGQLVPQDPNDEPASALLARIRAQREADQRAPARTRGRKTKATT